MEKGAPMVVHSYKHDGNLHRIWTTSRVVKHEENAIVLANRRTKVIESTGRFWFTKEPSVTWFFKENWFNVIGILRPNGTYYYCNIASPFVVDDEALKYVDYDLDVKVFPDGSYEILDRKEYERHKEHMDYPDDLKSILEKELQKLKTLIENKEGPFEEGLAEDYYKIYEKEGYHARPKTEKAR